MIAGVISLLIGLGIPIGGGIYFLTRRNGTFLSFLAGILSFAVSQLILRIPLMNFLSENSSAYYALMTSSA